MQRSVGYCVWIPSAQREGEAVDSGLPFTLVFPFRPARSDLPFMPLQIVHDLPSRLCLATRMPLVCHALRCLSHLCLVYEIYAVLLRSRALRAMVLSQVYL